jgi:pimeloyl-ACP methyl ester carboxylesterase
LTIPAPYRDYGGDGPLLHFMHANGYPHAAYLPLLECLAGLSHVLAMDGRPLWPGTQPLEVRNWQPFADDLVAFLKHQAPSGWIGVGHSIGGTTTLRTALQYPELFKAIVLIDPVIFPPWFISIWRIIPLNLAYRLHPLARRALRRRRTFESVEAMLDNYRGKAIFSRINDDGLQHYVNAMAHVDERGMVTLVYPPEWEARIYITAARADLDLWLGLPKLKPPLLILRGAQTDTFWPTTARLVEQRLPKAEIRTITGATHLLPLEKPGVVCHLIEQFLGALVDD